jgi:hypothetical protein
MVTAKDKATQNSKALVRTNMGTPLTPAKPKLFQYGGDSRQAHDSTAFRNPLGSDFS